MFLGWSSTRMTRPAVAAGGDSLAAAAWAADIRAKTADGRDVLLKDDGTWSFVTSTEGEKAASSGAKDKDATLAYEGKHKTFALHLKPGTWTKAEKPANPAAEVMFVHKDGDTYAMVIAERISVPLEVLKKAALANMQAEYCRVVNTADILAAL